MASQVRKDTIVIGGSAGSSAVLKQLFGTLPTDIPASIFVSTHMPAHAPSLLADVLAMNAALPVSQAVDGASIAPGRVYVAAPNKHMLLLDGKIRLGMGPRENMVRPSIDPLFRSAALSYGSRVIGVVLSGMLNDGAAGLHAVKAAGGTTIVQHPLDAEADSMPLAALEAVDVDYVVSGDKLAELLVHIAGTEAEPMQTPAEGLQLEVEIAAGARLGSQRLSQIAAPAALSCPECKGVMSEVIGSRPLRFRCQIGHAHTAETLAANLEEVDEAVRVAMRVMEERVTLVERMALDARENGRTAVAELYEARAKEYRDYAKTLRRAAIASLNLGQAAGEQDI